jgi:hypothetical protein
MKVVRDFFISPTGSIIIFLSVIAIWFFVGHYMFTQYYLAKNDGPTRAGTFGDMFGVINSLFAGLTVAGVVITILIQRKELEDSREALLHQQTIFQKQSFETTYFHFITIYFQLVDGLKGVNNSTGKEVFVQNDSYVMQPFRDGHPNHNYYPYSKDQYKTFLTKFNTTSMVHYKRFTEYYRHSTNILEFVINNPILSPAEKSYYVKSFFSLFSIVELKLMYFYIALNYELQNGSIKNFIREENIFEALIKNYELGDTSYRSIMND